MLSAQQPEHTSASTGQGGALNAPALPDLDADVPSAKRIKRDPDAPTTTSSFSLADPATTAAVPPFASGISMAGDADVFFALEGAGGCDSAGDAALEAFMSDAGSPDCALPGDLDASFMEEAWGAFAAPPPPFCGLE